MSKSRRLLISNLSKELRQFSCVHLKPLTLDDAYVLYDGKFDDELYKKRQAEIGLESMAGMVLKIHSHFDNIELVCDLQPRFTSGVNGLYLN